MRSRIFLSLTILLLIAAALPSCKSPTATTPAGPTLTLILPDSPHVYDTLAISASFSEPIQPTWLFAWQFGDSAKASTRWPPVFHIYDSAGTYTVQVAVTDTVALQTIAKQTGKITIMPLNTPTLTLTAPTTNLWGDSCVMNIHSSLPLKPSWAYSWSFGDSTTLTSSQSTILHYFTTPGTFAVRVSLSDTLHHIPLGSQTATVQVTARHFDLAKLQSMKSVDVTWQSKADTVIIPDLAGEYGEPCWPPRTFDSLTWNGTNFSATFNESTPNMPWPSQYDSSWDSLAFSGSVGMSSSTITSLSLSVGGFSIREDTEVGMVFGNAWNCNSAFSAENLPFKSVSDTDMVFEADDGLTTNASFIQNSYYDDFFHGRATWNINSNFSDATVNRYIRIRFHK